MSTVSTPPRARKPRVIGPRDHAMDRAPGVSRVVFTIFWDREAKNYWLSLILADFGVGYRLEQFACHGGEGRR